MKAEDIKDRETLEAWLRERPRLDAVVIAHRAALRVLPIWGAAMAEDWARAGDLTALPVLRCGLVSAVASSVQSAGIREAAVAASNAALASLVADVAGDASHDANVAVYAAVDAATYAYSADVSVPADTVSAFAPIRADALALEAAGDPTHTSLWPGGVPEALVKAEQDMLAIWDAEPAARWDFWRRWWAGAKTGAPIDPQLQLAIVQGIDEEAWKDPDKVAARIVEFERDFGNEGARADALDAAVEATPNAERVEGNPDSGLLFLVPDAGIPEDLFDYAARKVTGAIAMIQQDKSNQYTALHPDLAMLQAALDAKPALPVELFDACASATCRLALRCDNGDLPPVEKDPVLADYRNRLRDAAGDLYGNDPKTQAVVATRNAVSGNDVFVDNPEAVGAAVAEIEPALEGVLAVAVPRDADIATDPDAPEPERKVATYRLVSRVVRIAKIAGVGIGGGGAAIVLTKEVLEAIPVIQASPHFQKLLEFSLRWLGLG